MVTASLSQLVTTGTLTCLPCQLIIRTAELLRIRQFTWTLAPAKWNLHVTSLDKIRQTIDEVVAQVLLNQAVPALTRLATVLVLGDQAPGR